MWLDLRGEKLLSLFQLVPGPGIEPGRPKTGDFKSPASTVPPPRRELHPFYGRAGQQTNAQSRARPRWEYGDLDSRVS